MGKRLFTSTHNLGQNKIEHQTPIPPNQRFLSILSKIADWTHAHIDAQLLKNW